MSQKSELTGELRDLAARSLKEMEPGGDFARIIAIATAEITFEWQKESNPIQREALHSELRALGRLERRLRTLGTRLTAEQMSAKVLVARG